jgi:hypothetical protein
MSDSQDEFIAAYTPRDGGTPHRLLIGQPPLVKEAENDNLYLIIERKSAAGWVYDTTLGEVVNRE